jgi:carboxymethylenebutenolidase
MTETTPRAGVDPGAVFDAHVRAEFVERDVEATMNTMTGSPYVTHVPVLTGGCGREEVRSFYERHFVGRWPADTRIRPVSRTVGQGRVIDELILSFEHDVEMPALLPGVPPTGREIELPFVVIMGIEDGKVAYEHIYWDQASLLVQVGLLDPATLPVSGAEQARKLLDPTLPSNALIQRAEARRAGSGSLPHLALSLDRFVIRPEHRVDPGLVAAALLAEPPHDLGVEPHGDPLLGLRRSQDHCALDPARLELLVVRIGADRFDQLILGLSVDP